MLWRHKTSKHPIFIFFGPKIILKMRFFEKKLNLTAFSGKNATSEKWRHGAKYFFLFLLILWEGGHKNSRVEKRWQKSSSRVGNSKSILASFKNSCRYKISAKSRMAPFLIFGSVESSCLENQPWWLFLMDSPHSN